MAGECNHGRRRLLLALASAVLFMAGYRLIDLALWLLARLGGS